jgi:hypothetical protein
MARYHVIFRILNDDGVVRDYCREEPPIITLNEDPWWRERTKEESIEWADRMLEEHKLHSYEIQYW